MVTVYRGIVSKRILFPKSIILNLENLYKIDIDKVIYCEISSAGAMGHEGGILIYVLKDEDTMISYETNWFINQKIYMEATDLIGQNVEYFNLYDGGFGNNVYIKQDVDLEIDEKYECFWYHSKNTKLRIDSSVYGVFRSVVAAII